MNKKASDIFIIEAKRSALGKYGGALLQFSAPQITQEIISHIFYFYPHLLNKLDAVIFGNAISAGIGQNPARIAAIKSSIPYKVPAYTVNQVCGSGLLSVIQGLHFIQNNTADIVLTGGMESMSNAPYYLHKYRFGAKMGHQTLSDGMITDGLFCSVTNALMGEIAEKTAAKYHISRRDQDTYSLNSHKKAIDSKFIFQTEIIPIGGLKNDELPRTNTSLEKLSTLPAVFKKNGTVTAGNSSPLCDGASAILLASEKAVKHYNLKPKALIRSFAIIGCDPEYMTLGAYHASQSCLKKVAFKNSLVDLWEINEAFSSQMLAVIKLLDVDPTKINIRGGSIALGHPIGASGARILTTLVHSLQQRKLHYGVASLCVGGGQGVSILVENL